MNSHIRSAFARPRAWLLSLIAASLFLWLVEAPLPLDYVDVSPVGSQFPTWDSGDTGLRFADIDQDGQVDFLSIGDHGSPYINTQEHGIMTYFNDGAGGWSICMNGNFGYGGIGVGDVNGDGHLDVGYGMHHNYSSTDFGNQLLEVALGDGTGRNWTPWDDGLATNGEDWGMFATDFADVDGDGDLDVASNSFGCCNGVHVYLNSGDGTWTQSWALTGGNSRAHLCIGDVNGDGHPDIAASYQYCSILINNGAGYFTQSDTGLPSGTRGLGGVSLGDADEDGCADLSFTWNGGVNCYLRREDAWVPSVEGLPASGNYDVTMLRDMNGDGHLDILALDEGMGSVFLGDGTGHWTDGGGFTGSHANDTAALDAGGDIDHNGRPDLVFVQREGSWPSERNVLSVYKEASVPAQRFVVVQAPRVNETVLTGSVQVIRWSAAHVGAGAATIDIALSQTGTEGPWTPIVIGRPDSGHHQWTIPGPPTMNACVRVTLHQGGETVHGISRPFLIGPFDPAHGEADTAGKTQVLRIAPNPARGHVTFTICRQTFAESQTDIEILDALGRVVTRLMTTSGEPVSWNGQDGAGQPVPAGVYLARWPHKDAAGTTASPPCCTRGFLFLR